MSDETPLGVSSLSEYERWRAQTAERAVPRACDALCHAPFVSLLLDPRGNVSACCQSTDHPLGNVTEQPLSEIWRGDAIEAFRADLRNHAMPPGCERCVFEIERGNFQQVFARKFDPLPILAEKPEWPLTLWFMLSNACNLECVQCYGFLSSSIRKNREGLPPLPRVYDDAFFDDLRTILPNLGLALFLGGEPFLSRENFRVWDLMIEDKLQFPIHIVTNGTVFDRRVERVLDQIAAGISVSLDGATAATVESIRQNARFKDVMENLERFRHYTTANGTELDLSFCLMPQNYQELADFLILAEEKECGASVQIVYDPVEFSLCEWSAPELARVLETWEGRDAEMQRTLGRHLEVWTQEVERVQRWHDAAAGPP